MGVSDSASTSIAFWERVAILGGLAVIIGVLGEGFEVAEKALKREGFRKWIHSNDLRILDGWVKSFSPHTSTIEGWFFVLLIIGLAVELFGSGRAMILSDAENSRLMATNSVLSKRIEDLRAKNDKLEKETADLNKAAEEEFRYSAHALRESEDLINSSAPRTIDGFRYPEFVERLRKFNGIKFFVVTLTDVEPIRVGRKIESLLRKAGWQNEPMVKYAEADEVLIPDGIWIETSEPRPKLFPGKRAANELKEVLRDNSIVAMTGNPGLMGPLETNVLRIIIGLHPIQYFEGKKAQEEMRKAEGQRFLQQLKQK